jgi:hypothetical protein
MVKANSYGMNINIMMVNSKIIKWRVEVKWDGLLEIIIRAIS